MTFQCHTSGEVFLECLFRVVFVILCVFPHQSQSLNMHSLSHTHKNKTTSPSWMSDHLPRGHFRRFRFYAVASSFNGGTSNDNHDFNVRTTPSPSEVPCFDLGEIRALTPIVWSPPLQSTSGLFLWPTYQETVCERLPTGALICTYIQTTKRGKQVSKADPWGNHHDGLIVLGAVSVTHHQLVSSLRWERRANSLRVENCEGRIKFCSFQQVTLRFIEWASERSHRWRPDYCTTTNWPCSNNNDNKKWTIILTDSL